MKTSDKRILIKVVEEINVIEQAISQYTVEDFLKDEIIKRACGMALINIGELVKNLSTEIRQTNTDIPWKAMTGMRDVTAHKYQTLNMLDVWRTIEEDIPQVKKQILKIIE